MIAGPNGIAYNPATQEICFTDADNGRVRCLTEIPGGSNMRKGLLSDYEATGQLPEENPSISWPWTDPNAVPGPDGTLIFYESDVDGTLKLHDEGNNLVIDCF